MGNLAIKGHTTRGKEVIEILEMLGGINTYKINYTEKNLLYCLREGDNVIIATYPNTSITKIFTIERFLEKYPYKVGDKVYNIVHNENQTITNLVWDFQENEVVYQTNNNEYVYVNYLQPYKEENMGNKPNLLQQLKEYFENTPQEVIETEWHEYAKYNEIGPSVEEYLEYVNNIRQPQYPKTYEECCKITDYHLKGITVIGYKAILIQDFQKLIICRDAYWQIAGEQMGLDKPWKQDYNDRCFIIANNKGNIHTYEYHGSDNAILAFPTAEMRDYFYENFKELIETCKEFL